MTVSCGRPITNIITLLVAEAEICQLADIQDSIQRMREGDLGPPGQDKQSVEARLSSSCPSLIVDSGDEAAGEAGHQAAGQEAARRPGPHQQQRPGAGGHRAARARKNARSPSVSTGESDEDTDCVDSGGGGGHRRHAPAVMGVAVGGAGGAGLGPGLASPHKSVSTPSMVQRAGQAGEGATLQQTPASKSG